MMQLEYAITTDDLLAFARYQFKSSESVRRTRTLFQWGGAYTILFLLMAPAFAFGWGPLLGGGIAGAVFWALWYPAVYNRIFERKARALLDTYSDSPALGQRTLTLTEHGIHEESAAGERTTSWAHVRGITTTKDHAFIYISPLVAHVIPKTAVAEGEYQQFLAKAQERLDDSE